MTNKIGPKEKALQAAREGIPDFLKRTETPEQEAKRRKRDAKRPDMTGGLKVIEPLDPKIRKAIEKDLRDDKPPRDSLTSVLTSVITEAAIPVADLDKSENPKAIENKKSWDKIPAVAKAKKLPRVLQKALADKEKLNTIVAAKPMEGDMKKSVKKATRAVAKKAKSKTTGAARKSNGSYHWAAAEAQAKAGKIPPLPTFRSYASHIAKFYDLAKKKDAAGIRKLSAEYTDEKGARANMFRFRDLLLTALKNG